MLNHRFPCPYTHTNEVVKITVGEPFDVQIDRRPVNLHFGFADNVDFLFANRQCLEGMLMPLGFVSQPLWPAP